MKTYRYSLIALTCAVFAILLFNLSGTAQADNWWKWPFSEKTQTSPAVIVKDDSPIDRDGDRTIRVSYSDVVKKASPSVVTIKTSKIVQVNTNKRRSPFPFPFPGSPFGENPFGAPPTPENEAKPETPAPNEKQAPRQRKQNSGLGSGVIITADGYVMTNNHVIEGADEIIVVLNSGVEGEEKEMLAKVVGADARTDIAVLKVEGQDLPVAILGNSDVLEVGDVVLAIGYPFGFGRTVTMGIVSAKGREVGINRGSFEDFIQTDASINTGNSGGALVDAHGRVVGINTAIWSRSGGNIGIGFAVPINMAQDVMSKLVKHGKVPRGYLGVQIKPIDKDFADVLGLAEASGVLIEGVAEGSAAEVAGVLSKDVVVGLNGKKVSTVKQLRHGIAGIAPGESVTLTVIRDGKKKDIKVTLGELPGLNTPFNQEKESPAKGGSMEGSKLLEGVGFGPLDAATRKKFNINSTVNGVAILSVKANALAYGKLRPGDILQSIGNQDVKTAEDVQKVSREHKGKKMLLTISRAGNTALVIIKEDE